jgi:glycosyltransferase involved in cell wall biosynthesis
MRIGIDVRYLSHGLLGGVHTYVQQFLTPLIELASEHQIYLYADTKRPLELDALPDHVTTRYLPWRNPLSSAYNDFFFMSRLMATDRLDVAHFPANYGFGPPNVRLVLTVHDALNLLPLRETLGREILRGHTRNVRTAAMTLYLHYWTTAALRRADLVLTVSARARCDIARASGIDPKKIVPVPSAPAAEMRRMSDVTTLARIRARFGLTRPFVLADALKNPGALVRAWQLLPIALREGKEIVFFSRDPDPLPVVREAIAAGEARLLTRPARSDLIGLYSLAEVFVFPSWVEGFGLPVLEAMACGAPVIASDRGSIPEVAGEAALLVDADDSPMLARQIALVLSSPDEARRLRERGLDRAAQFSWRNTAKQILQGYERVMDGYA